MADLVRDAIQQHAGFRVNLEIKHVLDFRNYKVSIEKAENVLSFHPQHNVSSIVANLIDHSSQFHDWDNPLYYNLQAFKNLGGLWKEDPQQQMAMAAD
ncbi:MAG TPA: hypothetical protein VJ756_12710 [Terriglobales bacterium]|nr:hypothetical protein [Terriglobales bacterium]